MKMYKIAKKTIHDFSYGNEIHHLWDNALSAEMDRSNIHFDLENNEGYDFKTKDLDFTAHDGDKKFRVNAQICWAGGDWEAPICYFRCEFEDKTKLPGDDKWGKWRLFRKAIIIPIENNLNLVKMDSKYSAKDADNSTENKVEKHLWNEMVEIANKRVKEAWDAYVGDGESKDTGFYRELTAIK